jgi:hypothetical protein
MILRPLDTPPASSPDFLPAWPIIEHIEKQKYASCWLITQPSHAALAGELAAECTFPQLPPVTPEILKAISLHDYGWSMFDAQAIQHSRSNPSFHPRSFIAIPVAQFLTAWQESIKMAQTVSPAGGFIVSRHFYRLAGPAIGSEDDPEDRKALQLFLNNEDQRQKKLAAADSLPLEQLEALTDLLQFCDLLSLYICCGAQQNVILPQFLGTEVRITCKGEELKLDPPVVKPGSQFAVAALRHPAVKGSSGQQIEITFV